MCIMCEQDKRDAEQESTQSIISDLNSAMENAAKGVAEDAGFSPNSVRVATVQTNGDDVINLDEMTTMGLCISAMAITLAKSGRGAEALSLTALSHKLYRIAEKGGSLVAIPF